VKFLKKDTAAVISFGPFLDKTDGVSLEVGAGIITSIDHATTGIFLSKNGGAGAIRHQNVTASELDAYGMFRVTLDTTDTNTAGRLRVMMAEAATFLPVWDDFMVLPTNVYDSLMGTDLLDVNAAQWLGAAVTLSTGNKPDVNIDEISDDTTAPGNLELMYDGTGYAGGIIKQGVDLVAILGTALTETTGLLAGAFKKFFNVAAPTGTANSLPDAVPGTTGGLPLNRTTSS